MGWCQPRHCGEFWLCSAKAVGLGRDRLGLPAGCGVPHCPLPKLSWSSPFQTLAKQPSSPFSSSSCFPPASEAKQNAVLTKNNNRRQIQTMDKPPVRARATRILPEEDGIIRRPLRHLSIAAVCGPAFRRGRRLPAGKSGSSKVSAFRSRGCGHLGSHH